MSNQSVTSSVTVECPVIYASSASQASSGLPPVNPFEVLIQVISDRIMALMGLMASATDSMEQSTDAELQAQKMSNETNGVLVNLQNQVNDDGSADDEVKLPDDVVKYINDNHIIIAGITDGGDDGGFKELSDTATYNCGELEAIKGEFDVEATSYADSSSQTQMTIQEVAQNFSMSISEISQLMAKSNQVITTIVNNLK